MGDFFYGQFESFACREREQARYFHSAELFCIVFGMPERCAAVFGEHLDKQLFCPFRFRPDVDA